MTLNGNQILTAGIRADVYLKLSHVLHPVALWYIPVIYTLVVHRRTL